MRGSDLVGYPPSGLRWSADSQNLYFEWRQISEDKASTYVVGRAGGAPRKLADEDAKKVPPATGGRWDKARRRVLFVDGGDIVMVDAVAGTRRQITRTTGGESNPRWARNDTHVTWTREGNLFIAPLEGGGSELLMQLTDVSARRPEPRLTDSQRFIRDEEEKLIDFVEKQKADKKKAEEEQKKGRLPSFELQDRQTAVDLMLSPDGTHVFIVVAERANGMKPTIVPNYVTESGYTEDITGRTNVGDVQDRRMLAVLNLQTGKSVWADGSFAPPSPADRRAGEKTRSRHRPRRPVDRKHVHHVPRNVTSDGRCPPFPTTGSWSWRRRDRQTTRIAGTSRWTRRQENRASSICCTTMRGCERPAVVVAAAVRRAVCCVSPRQQTHLVPVRARRVDARLHARCHH